MLDWNFPAIKYFLREKIRRLPRAFRMQPEHDGVRGWLGRDSIYNRPRGVTEVLEEYLLRRTRQIPRDVVLLGNELCAEVEAAKGDRSTSVSPDAIRKAVAKVSKAFADEQISVCGNHLASDTMPPSAGRQNFSDFYTSALYSTAVQTELRRFIASVGVDRFPMTLLKSKLENAAGGILAQHPNPLNVLWLNGLLGYFHPIVGHTVHIRAAGDRPVRPSARPRP